jgi:two-component system, LytTR family, sensor kinase
MYLLSSKGAMNALSNNPEAMNAVSYHPSAQSWLFKYKLYHIPFWFAYNFVWWVLAVGNPVKAAGIIFFTPFFIKFIFYVVFQALAVYFNLYFLIPRYLEKGRYALYLFYLVLTIFSAAALIVPGYYLSALAAGKTMKDFYGAEGNCMYQFFGSALPSALASMTLAMSIKLAKNWIQTQRRHQLLEKEKLETELNFLKHQFNPHFLFNTINSIFFLIHKNPHMASASLAKFSDLLRYQLYECNDRQIFLSKEIACLENSIELERLRQNDNVEVTLSVNQNGGHAGHLGIAPFILMTFVENAFKHVSRDIERMNWIRIKLDLDGQRLTFSVANSTSAGSVGHVVHYGGIGLKNVQRRLDLIYPGQYGLQINNNITSFEIRLQMSLTELVVPQTMQETAAVI